MVKLEFEQQLKSGTVKRVLRNCAYGDNLYELSNGMLQYEGYKISDIDANDTGCVRFTNGENYMAVKLLTTVRKCLICVVYRFVKL